MNHFFNSDRLYITIHGNEEIDQNKLDLFTNCVNRLKNGEPIQYIVGETEFLDIKLKVGKGVFIPRPETEILVRKILELKSESFDGNIVDLCSGSGNIPIYLKKHMKQSNVWAIEKSEIAFKFLKKNSELNNVKLNLLNKNIFEVIENFKDNTFDIITSNPPYIRTEDIERLDKNIKFEPLMALDGGKNGIDFYEKIIENWTCKLKMGGIIVFEIGIGQANKIVDIMKNKFVDIQIIKDFSNIERIIIGTKS